MKKQITLISICLFCVISLSAQMNKESREKINTLKIAYLTEQLNLTSLEAEKFWPIYNAYDKEQNNLRNENRTRLKALIQKNGSIDSISEQEAEKLINLKIKGDKKLIEIQERFIEKIRTVISYKKLIKLQVSEMEFARKLMRKYKRKDSTNRE
ncbi:MAG: sensor of ECF-type sigma factor [Polaribacter sp.]|uniref:sensor of ECF-type sigma factor n=1 Tax=Polaribacter sp. TaxID=1920175 RepID=UPI003BB0B263